MQSAITARYGWNLQIKNANKKADKKSVKVVSYLLFVIIIQNLFYNGK